jgi:hypothetical protein
VTLVEVNRMITAIRVLVTPMIVCATQIYSAFHSGHVATPGASSWIAMNFLLIAASWLTQAWVVYRVARALELNNARVCALLAIAVPGLAGLLLSIHFSKRARVAETRLKEASHA